MSELSYRIAEIVDVQKRNDVVYLPRRKRGEELSKSDIYEVSLRIEGEIIKTNVRVEQNDPKGMEVKPQFPLPSSHVMVEAFRLCFEEIMEHLEKTKPTGNALETDNTPDRANGETEVDVRVMGYLTYIIEAHTFPQLVRAKEATHFKPPHKNSTHLAPDTVVSYHFQCPESPEIARYIRDRFSPHA